MQGRFPRTHVLRNRYRGMLVVARGTRINLGSSARNADDAGASFPVRFACGTVSSGRVVRRRSPLAHARLTFFRWAEIGVIDDPQRLLWVRRSNVKITAFWFGGV